MIRNISDFWFSFDLSNFDSFKKWKRSGGFSIAYWQYVQHDYTYSQWDPLEKKWFQHWRVYFRENSRSRYDVNFSFTISITHLKLHGNCTSHNSLAKWYFFNCNLNYLVFTFWLDFSGVKCILLYYWRNSEILRFVCITEKCSAGFCANAGICDDGANGPECRSVLHSLD